MIAILVGQMHGFFEAVACTFRVSSTMLAGGFLDPGSGTGGFHCCCQIKMSDRLRVMAKPRVFAAEGEHAFGIIRILFQSSVQQVELVMHEEEPSRQYAFRDVGG